jgi:hypothetical protein
MKLGTILNLKDVLEVFVTIKLPIKVAYDVSKFLKVVVEEFNEFQKLKDDRVRALGTPTSDGGFTIEPNTEGYKTFVKELNELAEKEIEVRVPKVDIDLLPESEKLSVEDVIKLMDAGILFEKEEVLETELV